MTFWEKGNKIFLLKDYCKSQNYNKLYYIPTPNIVTVQILSVNLF